MNTDLTSVVARKRTESKSLGKTVSVCPVCLQRIQAERVQSGEDIFLEKTCPEHGFTRTVIWRGQPDYRSWVRMKTSNHPQNPFIPINRGCPFDCGLCANHRQEPCCVLLEVTQRCDLGCPVCYASSETDLSKDLDLSVIEKGYQRMLEAGGPYNIQLSGGEPCLRDDLPEIIQMGRQKGFTYFQVNTNGLRISKDKEYLRAIKESGLGVVYLQFDGTDDGIYEKIRGRRILEQKIQAIQNCQELQLGVVLVPTVIPGINSDNLGDILRFALDHYPTVRSIHFQPVSYFGRNPYQPDNENRITLPELFHGMEEQTDGLVHVKDFQPKGSENSFCSFHASYIIMPDGSLNPIKQKPSEENCCCKSEDAKIGLMRSREFVAKNWVRKDSPISQTTDETVSLGGWDAILQRAKTHLFSISGMAFQDAWNLDLELLQDCCIQVMSSDGRLIPFCAYNLTNTQGQTLYRPVA